MKHITGQTNTNFWPIVRMIELTIALSTGLAIWRVYGLRATIRYLVGLVLAMKTEHAFLAAMIRKTGSSKATLADVMTLSRGASAAVLAGLVVSGIRDREGLAGKLGWSLILLEATAVDWLDGPLARKLGSSPLGAVMDIETDSWLTLWSAISAAAWGDLPRWCLLPPIARYLDPTLDLSRGKLPHGGGPWWSRLTGTAQMALFLAALAPLKGRGRETVMKAVKVAALPVSVGQGAAIMVLLVRKIGEN
jgi:phosphatidylglycerophosphate synthase